MLGGSTSKLAMLGSNLGNFILDFCLSNAGEFLCLLHIFHCLVALH